MKEEQQQQQFRYRSNINIHCQAKKKSLNSARTKAFLFRLIANGKQALYNNDDLHQVRVQNGLDWCLS